MKRGFTLAETLITLVIIGVVAALTVPTMIAKYQKEQTVTRLKKAYSTLGNAWQQSHFEFGIPEESMLDITPQEYFNKYWKKYFEVSKYCDSYQACGYKTYYPHSFPNGNNTGSAIIIPAWGFSFYTNDGILYAFRTKQSNNETPSKIIMVDINGSNGPNRIGKDLFYFDRYDNPPLGIKTNGYDASSSQINSECSRNGNGHYCATKIVKDGWQIKDDYPW